MELTESELEECKRGISALQDPVKSWRPGATAESSASPYPEAKKSALEAWRLTSKDSGEACKDAKVKLPSFPFYSTEATRLCPVPPTPWWAFYFQETHHPYTPRTVLTESTKHFLVKVTP